MIKITLNILIITSILLLSGCVSHTSMSSQGVKGPSIYIDDGTLESNIKIEGINIVKPQIEKGNDLVKKNNCENRVKFNYGDAQEIPFEDVYIIPEEPK